MNRLRKIALITILMAMIMMIASAFTMSSYATISSGYLTIKELRKSGYGYRALEKSIWKICESDSSGTVNYDHTIYCLKGGAGFGSTNFGSGTPTVRPYTKSFDMKNPSSITGDYAKRIPTPDMTNSTYKSLLWLLENVYVAPKTTPTKEEEETAAEHRAALLEKAGLTDAYLTDDDIDAVQQLAVWHFTNNDEYKVEYSGDSTFEFWINAIAHKNSNYNALSDYNDRSDKGLADLNGEERAEECQILYDYLISTAEAMGASNSGYQIATASKPYKLSNTKVVQKTEGDNYIIGPFQIDQISNTSGTLTGVFKNGNTVITPIMQDENGNRFNTIEGTVGKPFYIVLSKDTTIGDITLTISGVYFDTKITYWSVDGAPESDQPVVEVERTKQDYTETTISYDLELIKVDSKNSNIALNGATFEITLPDGTKQTKTTDSNGKITLSNLPITKAEKQTIKIKEITAPYGYQKLDTEISVDITIIGNGDSYSVSKAEINPSVAGAELSKKDENNKTKVTIKIKNTIIEKDGIFDLALRKFITAVGDKKLVDKDGKYIREPNVDVTPLLNGKDTARYVHNKKAVSVDVGDTVTYTIRVYNEGEVDGYVHKITDHLPPYLEFINDTFNASYGWKVSSDGRTVTTDITSPDTEYFASRDTHYANRAEGKDKVLLKAFNKETKKLDYIDVQIRCKVKDTGLAEKITNIAEITKQTDSKGVEVSDRDSRPNNVTLPTDDRLPDYKEDEIQRGDEYIPGQQDDDDFEKVIVQKFDLALRKFITGVNDKAIIGRVPTFSINSEGKMTYTHPKTPVEVVNGDTVIYTLRIYNEGNQSGYADEVKDNIPEGLVYLPDNTLNKTYRWKMYKADGTETENSSEAKTIRTDYLSKAQADVTKRDNLIKAFDRTKMTQPDYKEVKVAFKVTEPNTSDRILINTAEITKDSDDKGNPVDDIDSTPDNNKDGEDDIDIEKVKVKYFDLALEKIITQYSITLNGKTTVTKTGHKFGVQPEPVVKVETLKKTRKKATIKFKYQIKVTNEGEIAGYATEIKDYIPTGLKFVQKDNPKWKLSKDGKTITTDQLKNKLLQPGQSAIIEVVFQWINGENNLGLKQNWAEISKDKNDSNTPDIDSTPDNFKKGEDDIDDASVILSVVTGAEENYILIAGAVLVIIAGGLVLIKKFVI